MFHRTLRIGYLFDFIMHIIQNLTISRETNFFMLLVMTRLLQKNDLAHSPRTLVGPTIVP
jgi:hypothetical protein